MAPVRLRHHGYIVNNGHDLTDFEEENEDAGMTSRRARPRPVDPFEEDLPIRTQTNGRPIRVKVATYTSRAQHSVTNPVQVSSQLNAESPGDREFYDQDYNEEGDDTSPEPDTPKQQRKRTRTTRKKYLDDFVVPDNEVHSEDEYAKRQKIGARQSARSTRHQGAMQERTVDDIYRSDDDDEQVPARPRAVGAREIFQTIEHDNDFALAHTSSCESCGHGARQNGLVYCQGCSLAYHHECLGPRTARLHVVTKISNADFVLQCKRCVGELQKKQSTAPHTGKCQECLEVGAASLAFRARKTAQQEQKEREDNGGVDPISAVEPRLINNPDNILFRCTSCFRAWHPEHLPPHHSERDIDLTQEERLQLYTETWSCNDCVSKQGKISNIIAWRPSNESVHHESLLYGLVEDDKKQYLVKFEGESYFRVTWVSGAWLWNKITSSQRKAFEKREDVQQAKLTTAAAIPKEYLLADVVLDVRFKGKITTIDNIGKALVKYQGLSYEESFWETPPRRDDEHWADFVKAYDDWVLGQALQAPHVGKLKQSLQWLRQYPFQQLQNQPLMVTGGTLMEYQLAGVNWLFYKWFSKMNAILGDEMGLGKTIQIIALLAALVEKYQCYPFLIVVPNSTCPNWRREIKQWAPRLKVATYYGSRKSRDMIARYELFPQEDRQLKTHVLITSYEAAADPDTRHVFRGVAWQGLVVDEGQRLKNDESNLYTALEALKIPFKLLLTGTPLQNNQRELFNLLHFLDERLDAAKLEAQYQDLTSGKITELHDMIRPHLLRRTKRQVLSLPPMKQVVLPVSMSLVQKKVYKTILTKNAELMKTLLGSNGNKKADRGSLSNILIQLRKCLCHPFVYSRAIEERTDNQFVAHRNLMDASGKLKLLEIMLPLLQSAGHRVLIFSQFLDSLDIIEDVLQGMNMNMLYQRLDGNISSLEKQKRIDRFNEPGSPYFAFLLSTRAGGVGINLTTADTVIILDPDFNPHQDLQALSRAHRFGQTKPVLCFRLVTINSAEERIMSMGKRKLALDKALIQHIDVDMEATSHGDLLGVLQHGVKELFDDGADHAIVYDQVKVQALLDRHAAITDDAEDHTEAAEWSYAEVWKKDQSSSSSPKVEMDLDAWDKILQSRERAAAKEAAKKSKGLGRGRRTRYNVNYTNKLYYGVEEMAQPIARDEDDNDFAEQSEQDSDAQSRKATPTKRKAGAAEKKGKTTSTPRGSSGGGARRGRILFELGAKITKPRDAQPTKKKRGKSKTKKPVVPGED